ncbi:hypothetical protein L1286_04340 [Pseudoalteromonas sp. SMS1]|uniref:hypothetical protein n=1 Tax=Pseudoalteromonas sp. SMS1 TaxID=2908894 RepID=UPI001F2FF7F2|nr:hypothetical protein [Pseudoalteromonas sp. SMS1]MCF2856685.1 hypothetical protein [Pseudoalteromonas sp. SMS1]
MMTCKSLALPLITSLCLFAFSYFSVVIGASAVGFVVLALSLFGGAVLFGYKSSLSKHTATYTSEAKS